MKFTDIGVLFFICISFNKAQAMDNEPQRESLSECDGLSNDRSIGVIDSFVLNYAKKTRKGDISIKPMDYLCKPTPIFITINGSLQEIKMPTRVEPLTVIIHDAQNIINANPHIFVKESIEKKHCL